MAKAITDCVLSETMQLANRTTRRHVKPQLKSSAGNLRPAHRRSVQVPSPRFPQQAAEPAADDPLAVRKLVDRFRYGEPLARPERDFRQHELWWLHDEGKVSPPRSAISENHRDSNIPAFIQASPAMDRSEQDLDEPLIAARNRTFSNDSSDIGQVSSEGVGSTASTTTATSANTISTFQPPINERPARPIFTRFTDSKLIYGTDEREDDILYQWRLRRRLEQARHGEPITFPSKILHHSHASPARSTFPSVPIEVRPVHPASESLSPTHPHSHTLPTRQSKDVATQTLQDAYSQTSPIHGNAVSMHHYPSSSSEIEHHRKSAFSASAVKHRQTRFHPIRSVEPSVRNHRSDARHSSRESTFTHVTSMMLDNSYQPDQLRDDRSMPIVDSLPVVPFDGGTNIDYFKDEMMRMLIQRRDHLSVMFREIEQRLARLTT